MIDPKMLILPLFLPLLLGVPHSFGAETVIVNKTFDGREVTVRTGEAIRIELEQAGATGYVWAVHDLNAEHFEVLGEETRAFKSPDITGAPVLKIWAIKAIKEGNSELRFFYYRPWEGEKNAVDEFVLKLRIY